MVGEKMAYIDDENKNFEARKAICLQLLTDIQGMYIRAIDNIEDTTLGSIDKLALQNEALKIGEVANLVLNSTLPNETA